MIVIEHRVGPKRRSYIFEPDDPVFINRQSRDFPSSLFEFDTNAGNRRMLDRRRDDVAAMSRCRFTQTADGEVVCFSAA